MEALSSRRLLTRLVSVLARFAIGMALFVVVAPTPAVSSGPLLSNCPTAHAISA